MLTPIERGEFPSGMKEAIERAQRINAKQELFLFSSDEILFLVRTLSPLELETIAKRFKPETMGDLVEWVFFRCVLWPERAALDALLDELPGLSTPVVDELLAKVKLSKMSTRPKPTKKKR